MSVELHKLEEPKLLREAIADLWEGLIKWRVWVHLGLNDIRLRYRRSIIGQNWQTINMGILVFAISFVYASLLKIDFGKHLVYLVSAYIMWILIQSLVIESCSAFLSSEQLLLNYKLPLSVCVYQLVLRNLSIFAHSLLLVVPIFFITGHGYSAKIFLLIPALILFALNGIWVAIVLGVLSARFRDIPQIVSSFMQIAFLVTPVLYSPTSIDETHRIFLHLNPFSHFLAIGRDPLLGVWPPIESYIVVMAITLMGLISAIVVFSRARRQLAYWL